MPPEIYGYSGNVPPSEGAILSKVEIALDNSLEHLGLEPRETEHVKRQKYLWITVDHFTEEDQDPITHSWFKWGVSALAGPGEKDPSQPLFTDSADAQSLLDTSIEEFESYLTEDLVEFSLDDWWNEGFLDFLEWFYSLYAPDKYRDLYLAHLQLLRLIDDIQTAVMYGRDPARRETYYSACDYTTEIKEQVLSIKQIEDEYRHLSDFTNLFEDVVMMLVGFQPHDLEKGHQTAISELKDFYQDHVWLVIAHRISLDTAKGPNVEKILNHSSSNIQILRSHHEQNSHTNREICGAMGLIPDVADYAEFESEEDEFSSTFDNFMGVVDGRLTRE